MIKYLPISEIISYKYNYFDNIEYQTDIKEEYPKTGQGCGQRRI